MQEILIDSPADPTSATTHRSHPCPQRLLPPDSAARSARNRRSTNAIRGSCRADDGEPASPHTGIRLPCHQVLLSPTPALSSPLLPASSSSSPLDSESDDCSSGMTTLLRYRTYDKALACSSATPSPRRNHSRCTSAPCACSASAYSGRPLCLGATVSRQRHCSCIHWTIFPGASPAPVDITRPLLFMAATGTTRTPG